MAKETRVACSFRVPGSLARAIRKAAAKDGLTMNAWMLRCIERNLEASPRRNAGDKPAPTEEP
jgi:predicted HicB family RNase H-like nuclease